MKVRLRRELVEKRFEEKLVANGLNSKIEAAKEIGCDPRILKAAVEGNPIRLDTATKICKFLEQDPHSIIIMNSSMDMALPAAANEEKTEFSNVVIGAALSADAAINSSLNHHGENNPAEVGYVLTMLLYHNAANLPEQDRLYFVNTVGEAAKKALIHGGLASEAPENVAEFD